MTVKKICKIDGEKVENPEDLLAVIQREVGKTDGSPQSLNDLLNTSGGIDIVWQNADVSQEKMGKAFANVVQTIRDHGPDGARPTDNVHLFLN